MLHKFFWMLHFLSSFRHFHGWLGFFGKHYIKVDLFLHFLSISLEVESDAIRCGGGEMCLLQLVFVWRKNKK